MSASTTSHKGRSYYAAAIVGLLLALLTIVLLPLAIFSIVLEFVFPPAVQRHVLAGTPPPAAPTGSSGPLDVAYLDIAVASIDEAAGLISLRVSANRACPTTCAASRLLLYSLGDDLASQLGLPPVARLELPADGSDITETVQLPVSGLPSRYPWDTYVLKLGAVVETKLADGTYVNVLPGDQVRASFATLQSQLQRLELAPPVAVDPTTVRISTDPAALIFVTRLTFFRPLYLTLLTPLLVILAGAAAVYSVQIQPIQQLFVGSGGLVLGVWGVRSVLVPGSISYTTAVDLLLSMVILILLGGITVRATLFIMRSRVTGHSSPGAD